MPSAASTMYCRVRARDRVHQQRCAIGTSDRDAASASPPARSRSAIVTNVAAVGGLAQSFDGLVAARTQGLFAALLAPAALSLLTVTFAGTADWARAFGIYGAVAGGGGALGLLLRGGC